MTLQAAPNQAVALHQKGQLGEVWEISHHGEKPQSFNVPPID